MSRGATDEAAKTKVRTVYAWISRESDRWAAFVERQAKAIGVREIVLRDASQTTDERRHLAALWCLAQCAHDMRLLARWSRALRVADLAYDTRPCPDDAAALLLRRAEEFKDLGRALRSLPRSEGVGLPPTSFLAMRLRLAAESSAWLIRRFDPTSATLSIDDIYPAPTQTPPAATSR